MHTGYTNTAKELAIFTPISTLWRKPLLTLLVWSDNCLHNSSWYASTPIS